ncbi:hypothetical protein C7475_112120 [Chitinophaga sp. S165]|nr:hypothetical protein C7475_112120 [Chitinophaga sp. S165]
MRIDTTDMLQHIETTSTINHYKRNNIKAVCIEHHGFNLLQMSLRANTKILN